MKPISRQWSLAIGLSCLMALVAGMGFFAGRYSIIRTFDRKIQGFARAFTLGPLLNSREKEAVSRVYHDGKLITERLDAISWSVPNASAPFVGSIPAPGDYPGAHINSLQFRAATEVSFPKPANTFRIFLVGGSTAYGSGSPDQDRTIGGYLADYLARDLTPVTGMAYEVFTMANPAWSSTHERIIIENRLSEMDPDLVISFSGTNDVHWGVLGRDIFWFRTYADEFFHNILRRVYRLTDREFPDVVPRATSEDVPPSVVAERLLKNVSLSAFVLARTGVDYVFILQPTLATTRKHLSAREKRYFRYGDYFHECYSSIDKELQGLQTEHFSYVNLVNIFDRLDENEDIFLDSYHFGDKGNEVIAQQIFGSIKEIITK